MTTLLADYERERQAFDALLSPDCRERILLFCGESGGGKTPLLAACLERMPTTIPCIPIQLRGSAVGVAEIFYRAGRRLDWKRLPHFTGRVAALEGVPQVQVDGNWLRGINNSINVALRAENPADQKQRRAALTDAWFQDLSAFDHPVLVALDTYEQAPADVADWIGGPFLARVEHTPSLRVLLAGQTVPALPNIEWGHCCVDHELLGVPEAKYWLPVVEAMQRYIPSTDWLAGVCYALDGNPAKIIQAIESLPRRRGES